MAVLFWAIISISILFVLLLGIKELFPLNIKKKFCVICAAVSLTWFGLLVLYWLGIFQNKLSIALLMGSTVLGVFYLAEKYVGEKKKLFRLPFFLTLFVAAYFLLEIPAGWMGTIIMLLALWLIFVLLYSYKNNRGINVLVKKLIECCRRW